MKDIWKDFNGLDEGVRAAVCVRERLEHILENTLWLDEYSEVWICSGMTNEDFVHDGITIHASKIATKASVTFSVNGRPHNTREALAFVLAVIQSVRQAYDKDSVYATNDYLMIEWPDKSILGGWNKYAFQRFGELYFLMKRQPFLHEWTRDGSKGNYPWTIFLNILQLLTAMMPGTVEPYHKLKRMFDNVHIEMRPELYELVNCDTTICPDTWAQGRSGEIRLPKKWEAFFTSAVLDVQALEKAPYDLQHNGYALISKTVSSYSAVESRLYEFDKPYKNITMDNVLTGVDVRTILDQCSGRTPQAVFLRLFKKSHSVFIALYMGAFAPSPEYGPVDVFLGVRRDIGMSQQAIINHQIYSNGPEIWETFVNSFCDSLNLLCRNCLPEDFRSYFSETILNKFK